MGICFSTRVYHIYKRSRINAVTPKNHSRGRQNSPSSKWNRNVNMVSPRSNIASYPRLSIASSPDNITLPREDINSPRGRLDSPTSPYMTHVHHRSDKQIFDPPYETHKEKSRNCQFCNSSFKNYIRSHIQYYRQIIL